jgi:hypothetical protein
MPLVSVALYVDCLVGSSHTQHCEQLFILA